MLPQEPLQAVLPPTTLVQSYLPVEHASLATTTVVAEAADALETSLGDAARIARYNNNNGLGSTAKGIMIGVFSVLGAAGFCFLFFAVIYYFRYTQQGRVFLDRITRPGEYDDEQQFAKEEAEALEEMDDLQRAEYLRAKGRTQKFLALCLPKPLTDNDQHLCKPTPPNPCRPTYPYRSSSLSRRRASPRGSSSQSSRLPIALSKAGPRLSSSTLSVACRATCRYRSRTRSTTGRPRSTKSQRTQALRLESQPNPILCSDYQVRPLPHHDLILYIDCHTGYHKSSIAYGSNGNRRYNQAFTPSAYGPAYVQGDVIGVGYRPRTGTIFFTRNGKKLDDVAHGLKTQNFFPTVGAQGPCQVHVNFGQMGFVFIEANVKKWGLAPQTGSLAPPPPYGSEQGSILLDSGREGIREGMGGNYISAGYGHARSHSQQVRLGRNQPTSPGPQRSPTDISLAAFSLVDSNEDIGEGPSAEASNSQDLAHDTTHGLGFLQPGELPPEYTSPVGSPNLEAGRHMRDYWEEREQTPLLQNQQPQLEAERPLPSYDIATANTPQLRQPTIRVRSATETSRTPRGGRR